MSFKILDLLLLATREQTIILLFVIGMSFARRNKFYVALALLLFTMIYNHWLKSIFAVPLPPSVGKDGWAFPSGHMHGAAVFWGYIMLSLRERPAVVLSGGLVLTGVAVSLVLKGYHYPSDVLAALAFAGLSLAVLLYLESRKVFAEKVWLEAALLAVLGNLILVAIPAGFNTAHLCLANGAILGLSFAGAVLRYLGFDVETPRPDKLSLGEFSANGSAEHPTAASYARSFASLGVALLGAFALLAMQKQLLSALGQPIGTFVVYFMLAAWLTFIPCLVKGQRLKKG